MTKTIRIAFIDWWGGWNPTQNFFTELLRHSYNLVVLDSSQAQQADLVFYSIFGDHHHIIDPNKLIHFSGESHWHTHGLCRITCNQDTTDRNICLPLWSMFLDWFGVTSYGNPDWLIPLEYICERPYYSNTKAVSGNIFALVGNLNPDSLRTKVLATLNNCGIKNLAGKITNTYRAKHDIFSTSLLTIAMENKIQPGYLTEKIVQSYAAGTVPIVLDIEKINVPYINKEAILNVDSDELFKAKDPNEYFRDLVSDALKNGVYQHPLFINNKIPKEYSPLSILNQLETFIK